MFWRFGGYANISTLDSILDKPDVTLEELLDESDLIQELKAQNAKLIDFLRDEIILERLLKFVLAPKPSPVDAEDSKPEESKSGSAGFFKSRSKVRSKSRDEDSDQEKQEQKRTKYAYVSCEILSSEVYSIYEALLDKPQLLKNFWQYIQTESTLDPIQAGYFTKVNEALLEKKTEDMIAFIKTLDNVVKDMMQHVDCPMVMDLLLKLISLEKESEGQGIVDWLQAQDLIPMLLSYITPMHSPATQTSAGDFLKAIITISANATGQDTSVIGPNELTRQLVTEPCITSLTTEMLKGGNALTVGVGIVIEVIRKNNSDYDSETQIGPEPKSSDPIYLGTLLRTFALHIKDFMELILSPRHTIMTEKGSASVERKDLKVAWGDKIEPLGFDRFKTCELMAELLHCSNMGLLNEKGSDAAIQARDEERERLKAEGKLAALQQAQPPQADFSTSVDSSGFHHAEDFTPLGESPETVKRLEIQNNADDDEFEKVALSEGDPDVLDGQGQGSKDSAESAKISEASKSGNGDDSTADNELSRHMADLEIDASEAEQSSSEIRPPRSSSKQPISLLAQQLKASKEHTLSQGAGLDQAEQSSDAPAPLFSKRPEPAAPQQEPSSHDSVSDMEDFDLEGGPGGVETDVQAPHGEVEEVQNLPVIEREDNGSPVVGDLLKMHFVDNRVVPTILDFFFRFPWNNFLHNVVYDVVQQVFNGSMDRGFNRNLAIDLFETGRITDRVIEGQQRSDQAQAEQQMRLGYMGHLTLIAEEVVKFTERQPAELLAPVVVNKVTASEWINYVEQTLTETRDRDNAILGGVRPDVAGGPRQAVLNAVNAAQGLGGATGSAALANAGLGGGSGPQGLDSMDLANAGSAYGLGSGNLLSGFGSSDDEDEDDLEDAELAEGGGLGHTQLSDEDQPSDIPSSTDPNEGSSGPSGTPNTNIPAPLAIPPSRARRQLAARLAEKKRLANADGTTDEPSSPSKSTATANRTDAFAPGNAGNGQGFADNFTGFSGSEDEGSEEGSAEQGQHSSDEGEGNGSQQDDNDVDSDDGAEGGTGSGLVRQVREATPGERRPLDDSDDEDDAPTKKDGVRKTKAGDDDDDKEGEVDINDEDDLEVEDYWRLGELRQAAAQRAALSNRSGGAGRSGPTSSKGHGRGNSTGSGRGSGGSGGSAKQREQERLLQQWGLTDRSSGSGGSGSRTTQGDSMVDEDDDDDSDDDAPVEMGTKYMSRRASANTSSSAS